MPEPQGRPDEERTIEALLRAVGPRSQPPDSMAAEVRAAVAAEWRARAAAKSRRRFTIVSALAAGLATVAVASWLMWPSGAPVPQVVASLERSEAQLESRGAGGDWQPVQVGDPIMAPGELRSRGGRGAALKLATGVDLRIDGDTRITLADAHHVELIDGAIYVDSGLRTVAPDRDLLIGTPQGTVHHLGTQYQVRLTDDGLSVAVREGRVSLVAPRGSYTGAAGEQLLLTPRGMERRSIAPHSADWGWVAEISPPFDIEGRSVEEFLAWASRETGRSIRFVSPGSQQLASETRLRGSIEGLDPGEALEAVLATTRLNPTIREGEIEIRLRD